MACWLMKSEPDVYSVDDLKKKGKGTWEGVRNYQARNHMRAMKEGELALFYHSSTEPPGVVGVMKIIREAYPDPFQHDKKSEYFDPKSKKEDPRWSAVDVGFVEKWKTQVTLEMLRADPELEGLIVLQRGSRLSVTPVSDEHFARILALGGSKLNV
jgi:predicted RNA-binding protein with PUA-like domain